MATRSRTSSQAQSPFNQGYLEPQLPPTAALELGEVSLECVTRLLLGLLGHVERLERDIIEIKEAGVKTRTNVKNISQTVNVVKDGLRSLQLHGPCTPEGPQPKAVEETPRPLPKAKPMGSSSTPASPFSPSISASPIPHWSTCPSPPAPIATYSAPVKVDHPDAYTGKIGSEAKQWLTRMLAWTRLNSRMFPTNQEVLSFLLMNMKDSAGAWAHPHLDQLGSHRAIIQTVEGFKLEFLAAFGDPDATRAAERKITSLTQSGTCADYITKFRTLAMELDWNNAALRGQFARGLHWEVSRQIATRERRPQTLLELQNAALVIDNALREERASHPPRDNKPSRPSNPARGRVPAKSRPVQKNSPTIPTSCRKRNETAAAPQAPASSAARWATRSHAAILGLKWLDAHNPEIDWNSCTLSFPHTPPEHVAIAEEEEADKNPLEGVPPEYHQYAKVFGEEEFNKLPPHRHYDIGIKLTEEGPLNSPLYSMTDAESATLKDWLRDELKAGKIRPSKSSISSPVMFVPKKDGSRRLVVDYRRLNNRTKKNVYPLPRPDDLMAQLRGAKVFTKLDLRWGYNNVRVKEGDEWKTAFRTKYGLYESLVMTFGLTNAPAAFQHFMNKLFKDLLDVCVIIYLDDILIYSKDDATHTHHVMNLDKLKIQAVQEWPTPVKVKEVQSFLGFANFLRCFVANFSHMARPLHNLVKKDTPWKWDTKEQEAFQGLKDTITNAPVLRHANPTKPYFLETDASGAALGSILSQRQEDGRLHPLGFLSKSFKGASRTMTHMIRSS
ncbi:hypothetical protein RHS01_09486 [Rhizoctonia solani]|uniref:Reverse transcriptase domain-containing protein n=1 Tax=Rhizoctonia solani TaxID=456999 RepID=A0A8H7I755_9AGAM|nr:hypothetical protein RHS01_09486 [Rhizoctonia solani]